MCEMNTKQFFIGGFPEPKTIPVNQFYIGGCPKCKKGLLIRKDAERLQCNSCEEIYEDQLNVEAVIANETDQEKEWRSKTRAFRCHNCASSNTIKVKRSKMLYVCADCKQISQDPFHEINTTAVEINQLKQKGLIPDVTSNPYYYRHPYWY